MDDTKVCILVSNMSEAWELAKAGDRVFLKMPGAKTGPVYKLVRICHGPYCVLTIDHNGLTG